MKPAFFALLAFAAALCLPAQPPAGGEALFQKRCGGCHALDRDKEGPRLSRVYGRAAGSLDSFEYSDALKRLKIRWNEETLGQWLTDPDKMAPGNNMPFRVSNPDERKAIIDYLKQTEP